MLTKGYITMVILSGFLLVVTLSSVVGNCARPSLLVVSFDGFRHDYFKKNASPNMLRLRDQGTYTEHMKNVFPTKTYVNHHSIATGVYPEVHGVLSNHMFDPNLKRELKYEELWNTNKDVVPIWILNEQTGCYSGTSMWPGSDIKYQNKTSFKTLKYNVSMPWEERVDTFTEWFSDPRNPVNLVMAYFEEPDMLSHEYGPDSPQVLGQIKKVDNLTAYIHRRLREKRLDHKVNVILISDHGMVGVNSSRILTVLGNVDNSTFIAVGTSPVFQIWPNPELDAERVARLLEAFKNESKAVPHSKVYELSEIPEGYHYKKNVRAPPILLVADEGYAFQDLLQWNIGNQSVSSMTWGVHGYDNQLPEMWPFFMAWGPQIKSNTKVAPFSTLDLYSLFSSILDVQPGANNGTYSAIKGILKTREEPMTVLAAVGITLLVLFIIVGGLIIAYLMRRADQKRPRRNEIIDSSGARPEDNPLLDPKSGEQSIETQ